MCTSLHTSRLLLTVSLAAVVSWVAVMCFMESPPVPLHQTLILNQLFKLKKKKNRKKQQTLQETLTLKQTQSSKIIHSSFSTMVLHPHSHL